jgi:hypothetical protein
MGGLQLLCSRSRPERRIGWWLKGLSVLLLTSFFAIPLARQCCFDAALFTGLQVVGVTLYFLDNVFLLYLALEPAQRILERFAFLHTNFSQNFPPPNLPERPDSSYLSLRRKTTKTGNPPLVSLREMMNAAG